MRNGYKIIPVTAIPEEQRKTLEIFVKESDARVVDEESFNSLKNNEGVQSKKILLVKELQHE